MTGSLVLDTSVSMEVDLKLPTESVRASGPSLDDVLTSLVSLGGNLVIGRLYAPPPTVSLRSDPITDHVGTLVPRRVLGS